MNRAELELRAAQWRRHHRLRGGLVSVAVGLLAACGLVRVSSGAGIIAGVLGGLAAGLIWWRRTRWIGPAEVAAHLNRLCPTIQESAALWLREPTSLDLVERLQHQRLNSAWESLPHRDEVGRPPGRILRGPLIGALAATIALVTISSLPRSVEPVPAAPLLATKAAGTALVPVAATLQSASLRVQPPAYLGLPERRIEGLDGEVQADAIVTWEIAMAGECAGLALHFAGDRSALVAERVGAGQFRITSTVTDTLLYRVAVTQSDGAKKIWPQLHALKAVPDTAPEVAWEAPSHSRTVVEPTGRPMVAVRVRVKDDHRVADVHLVATVAKGSGEGVKFRDQVLPLTRDAGDSGANGDGYATTLDLNALGLEPGDEVYFHALATDRRTPRANATRSETRFVVLRGPATELADPGTALAGINLVPQYFRSQRQLIIDTEQLLAERSRLNDDQFRQRSEDIGIDQKLLRLRYGQFLGEEFEPASIGAPREAEAMSFATQLRRGNLDTTGRAAAINRAIEAQHQHTPAADDPGRPKTAAEIAAPFVHNHDNAEAATLFDLQVKASLRSVLAAMWEAEGLLRSGRPAAALPAENRALELLKALQQADRVYVKRVGFEPTPIKVDERRLRGELDAIPKAAAVAVPLATAPEDVAALRYGLQQLGGMALAAIDEAKARAISARLALAATSDPKNFLGALEVWQRRETGISESERAALRRALWSILPAQFELPRRETAPAPALARDYFKAIAPATSEAP